MTKIVTLSVVTIIGILLVIAAAMMMPVRAIGSPVCDFNYPNTCMTGQSVDRPVSHERRKARRHHRANKAAPADANGNLGSGVVRSKTGATARVSPQVAQRFQALVDDLETNHGSSVRFMGGVRRGKCWSGGMHPCGKALDLCQLSRGRVDSRCRLPSRHELNRIAAAHGLSSGGLWCHHDHGHIQASTSASACGTTLAARRHTKRVRYARATITQPTFIAPDRFTAN